MIATVYTSWIGCHYTKMCCFWLLIPLIGNIPPCESKDHPLRDGGGRWINMPFMASVCFIHLRGRVSRCTDAELTPNMDYSNILSQISTWTSHFYKHWYLKTWSLIITGNDFLFCRLFPIILKSKTTRIYKINLKVIHGNLLCVTKLFKMYISKCIALPSNLRHVCLRMQKALRIDTKM